MDFGGHGNYGERMFKSPEMVKTLVDLVMSVVPVWLAVMIGLIVGWAWRPRWAGFIFMGLRSLRPQFVLGFTPSVNAFLTAFFGFPLLRNLWTYFRNLKSNRHDQNSQRVGDQQVDSTPENDASGRKEVSFITEKDLDHFCQLLTETDGGPTWHLVMDRTTPTMTYQCWRRDPEAGPPEYRSRSVYEDITPELMRDFFWDDEFRLKWDNMLVCSKTLEVCQETGTMVVHWVRKFPFFCSAREYVIGRRIWESGRTYYCVTKGVPYPSLPRLSKPRRVDLYYSSWCIRPAKSRNGDALSACEVVLFHHEDMGIPWELAKIGVRHGMWGTVKNIERGLYAYKKERNEGSPLSSTASMARICTKLPRGFSNTLESSPEAEDADSTSTVSKTVQGNAWKFVMLGGAVALACGLDRGVVSKVLIFGLARRLGKFCRRL
eukprot:TRINITY_DN254_c0_g2_i1.p1 TRINITY_DN254_c0_g2~~TRINITY_DN254_c0_g2_i1.p1  ORF type:complete len:433 (+),score=49.99 TRINITY_DN254_c0_g2_i1:404-1702(+)